MSQSALPHLHAVLQRSPPSLAAAQRLGLAAPLRAAFAAQLSSRSGVAGLRRALEEYLALAAQPGSAASNYAACGGLLVLERFLAALLRAFAHVSSTSALLCGRPASALAALAGARGGAESSSLRAALVEAATACARPPLELATALAVLSALRVADAPRVAPEEAQWLLARAAAVGGGAARAPPLPQLLRGLALEGQSELEQWTRLADGSAGGRGAAAVQLEHASTRRAVDLLDSPAYAVPSAPMSAAASAGAAAAAAAAPHLPIDCQPPLDTVLVYAAGCAAEAGDDGCALLLYDMAGPAGTPGLACALLRGSSASPMADALRVARRCSALLGRLSTSARRQRGIRPAAGTEAREEVLADVSAAFSLQLTSLAVAHALLEQQQGPAAPPQPAVPQSVRCPVVRHAALEARADAFERSVLLEGDATRPPSAAALAAMRSCAAPFRAAECSLQLLPLPLLPQPPGEAGDDESAHSPAAACPLLHAVCATVDDSLQALRAVAGSGELPPFLVLPTVLGELFATASRMLCRAALSSPPPLQLVRRLQAAALRPQPLPAVPALAAAAAAGQPRGGKAPVALPPRPTRRASALTLGAGGGGGSSRAVAPRRFSMGAQAPAGGVAGATAAGLAASTPAASAPDSGSGTVWGAWRLSLAERYVLPPALLLENAGCRSALAASLEAALSERACADAAALMELCCARRPAARGDPSAAAAGDAREQAVLSELLALLRACATPGSPLAYVLRRPAAPLQPAAAAAGSSGDAIATSALTALTISLCAAAQAWGQQLLARARAGPRSPAAGGAASLLACAGAAAERCCGEQASLPDGDFLGTQDALLVRATASFVPPLTRSDELCRLAMRPRAAWSPSRAARAVAAVTRSAAAIFAGGAAPAADLDDADDCGAAPVRALATAIMASATELWRARSGGGASSDAAAEQLADLALACRRPAAAGAETALEGAVATALLAASGALYALHLRDHGTQGGGERVMAAAPPAAHAAAPLHVAAASVASVWREARATAALRWHFRVHALLSEAGAPAASSSAPPLLDAERELAFLEACLRRAGAEACEALRLAVVAPARLDARPPALDALLARAAAAEGAARVDDGDAAFLAQVREERALLAAATLLRATDSFCPSLAPAAARLLSALSASRASPAGGAAAADAAAAETALAQLTSEVEHHAAVHLAQRLARFARWRASPSGAPAPAAAASSAASPAPAPLLPWWSDRASVFTDPEFDLFTRTAVALACGAGTVPAAASATQVVSFWTRAEMQLDSAAAAAAALPVLPTPLPAAPPRHARASMLAAAMPPLPLAITDAACRSLDAAVADAITHAAAGIPSGSDGSGSSGSSSGGSSSSGGEVGRRSSSSGGSSGSSSSSSAPRGAEGAPLLDAVAQALRQRRQLLMRRSSLGSDSHVRAAAGARVSLLQVQLPPEELPQQPEQRAPVPQHSRSPPQELSPAPLLRLSPVLQPQPSPPQPSPPQLPPPRLSPPQPSPPLPSPPLPLPPPSPQPSLQPLPSPQQPAPYLFGAYAPAALSEPSLLAPTWAASPIAESAAAAPSPALLPPPVLRAASSPPPAPPFSFVPALFRRLSPPPLPDGDAHEPASLSAAVLPAVAATELLPLAADAPPPPPLPSCRASAHASVPVTRIHISLSSALAQLPPRMLQQEGAGPAAPADAPPAAVPRLSTPTAFRLPPPPPTDAVTPSELALEAALDAAMQSSRRRFLERSGQPSS